MKEGLYRWINHSQYPGIVQPLGHLQNILSYTPKETPSISHKRVNNLIVIISIIQKELSMIETYMQIKNMLDFNLRYSVIM